MQAEIPVHVDDLPIHHRHTRLRHNRQRARRHDHSKSDRPGPRSRLRKAKSDAVGLRPMKLEQVDISGKPVSFREATARGSIRLKEETIKRVRENKLEKGDALAVARTMAILTVKRTPDVIALCHPLRVEGTRVDTKLSKDRIEVT